MLNAIKTKFASINRHVNSNSFQKKTKFHIPPHIVIHLDTIQRQITLVVATSSEIPATR